MLKKIKAHLERQLKVLSELVQCLETEARILKKGTSDDVMSIVYQKQQLIRQLNELELVRFQLLKQETFETLEQKYPKDEELRRYRKSYVDCCEKIQRLNQDNRELTQHARQVAMNRMSFYTELVRQSQYSQNTYARGGAYQKAAPIGSAILERTL